MPASSASGVFLPVFARTCLLAAEVAAITLVLGYPVADLAGDARGPPQARPSCCFAIPLLMSYIIKIYAIRAILGGNGFLNRILSGSASSTQPIELLPVQSRPPCCSRWRCCCCPSPSCRSSWRWSASRAACSKPRPTSARSAWQTFRRVVLPLSPAGRADRRVVRLRPGARRLRDAADGRRQSGFTFGRIVYSQFGLAFNWPFGAALSVDPAGRRLARSSGWPAALGRPRGLAP